MFDNQILKGLLMAAALTGGGAGVYALLNQWPRYALFPSKVRRYIAVGANILVAIGGYLGLVGFNYIAAPLTPLAWFETLVGIAATLFTASQVVQARDL